MDVQVGRRSPYPEEFRRDAVALYRASGGVQWHPTPLPAPTGLVKSSLQVKTGVHSCRQWLGRCPGDRVAVVPRSSHDVVHAGRPATRRHSQGGRVPLSNLMVRQIFDREIYTSSLKIPREAISRKRA